MELNLFPTKIYRFKSNIDTHPMIKPILDLEVGKDLHYGQESGGLQGGGWIYNTTEFDSVRLYIDKTIKETFGNDCNILDVWTSIYKKGDYNKIHNHPPTNPMYYDSNLWAGVFYIKTNKNGGRLVIHSPQNPTNTEDFYPEDGELFLFNSFTYHSVTPNLSDDYRICIAFNFTTNS